MDILRQLTADHRQLLFSISQINSVLFDEENQYFTRGRKTEATNSVLRLLKELLESIRRHERIEHRLLFPAVLKRLPGLRRVLEAMESEHQNIIATLTDFQKAMVPENGVSNREIINRFLELNRAMEAHMLREEAEIFEPAYAHLKSEEREQLGQESMQKKELTQEAL